MESPQSVLISAMLRTFNRPHDELVIQGYLKAIEACDQSNVRRAIGALLANSTHCPTPADLRMAINEVGAQSLPNVMEKIYDVYELQAVREWDKAAETYHEALERVHQRHGIPTKRTKYFLTKDEQADRERGVIEGRPKIKFKKPPEPTAAEVDYERRRDLGF